MKALKFYFFQCIFNESTQILILKILQYNRKVFFGKNANFGWFFVSKNLMMVESTFKVLDWHRWSVHTACQVQTLYLDLYICYNKKKFIFNCCFFQIWLAHFYCTKINTFNPEKRQYFQHYWSDKGFNWVHLCMETYLKLSFQCF